MTVNLVEQLDDFRLVFEEFKEKWTDENIFSLLAKATDRIEILQTAMMGVLTETEETAPSIVVIQSIARAAIKGEE